MSYMERRYSHCNAGYSIRLINPHSRRLKSSELLDMERLRRWTYYVWVWGTLFREMVLNFTIQLPRGPLSNAWVLKDYFIGTSANLCKCFLGGNWTGKRQQFDQRYSVDVSWDQKQKVHLMSKLLNLPGELLLWYVRAAAVGEGGLNRPITGDDSYLCLISTSLLIYVSWCFYWLH